MDGHQVLGSYLNHLAAILDSGRAMRPVRETNEESLKKSWPEVLGDFTPKKLPSLKLTAKAPENRPLEKDIPIGNHHFQGRTVSFRECNIFAPRNGGF